jgi:hypothetical protein
MNFLSPKDYHIIIESASELNEKNIPHYFFNQYQLHNLTNTNFVNNLKDTILELDERFQLLIERNIKIRQDEDKVKKVKKKIDYRNSIEWNNESFYYYEGKLNHEFPLLWHNKKWMLFTINKLEKIKIGFEEFITNIEAYELNKNIPKNNLSQTQKITLTQKIHILNDLGFFDLDKIKNLTETDKGKIISLILGTSQKNTYDEIRERYNTKEKNKVINELNEILLSMGLK